MEPRAEFEVEVEIEQATAYAEEGLCTEKRSERRYVEALKILGKRVCVEINGDVKIT
jgi:hypothetical protein